jgi:hypothetical protein
MEAFERNLPDHSVHVLGSAGKRTLTSRRRISRVPTGTVKGDFPMLFCFQPFGEPNRMIGRQYAKGGGESIERLRNSLTVICVTFAWNCPGKL